MTEALEKQEVPGWAYYACPKCGSINLRVTVRAEMELLQDKDGNVQTYDSNAGHDHEWDGQCPMRCEDCGHVAQAIDFEVDGA